MSLVPKELGEIGEGADVDRVLDALTERVPGVTAAVIFDASGLALSHVVTGEHQGEVDEDAAAAVGAGLIRSAVEAVEATGGASGEGSTSVWVKTEGRNLYCVQLGAGAFAAAVSDPEVPAGLLMYRMDKWAAQAADAIGDLADLVRPPKRKRKAIEADSDADDVLAAVEVTREEIGPVGVGRPPEHDDAENLAADEATALYAAASAAAEDAGGAAEVEDEDDAGVAAGDWVVVDLVEAEVPAAGVIEPEPEPEPELAVDVVESVEAVGLAEPEPIGTWAGVAAAGTMGGLAAESLDEAPVIEVAAPAPAAPPPLADAMQAWLAPPPIELGLPEARPIMSLDQAPPPVGRPVAFDPPPEPEATPSLSRPPSGPRFDSMPPPVGFAPSLEPAQPAPQAAGWGTPGFGAGPVATAADAPVGPSAAGHAAPSAPVWAPVAPVEEDVPDQSTPPWAAYGGSQPTGG